MTVKRVRVGDVLRLQRRAVSVTLDKEYEEIGIRSFGRGIFHKEPTSGAELGNKRVFWIKPGDLVISNVFAWEGAVAIASEAEDGKIGSHRFMTFTPIDGRLDATWAAWFFRSEPGLELIRIASPGSAGRNRTLAVERFESLEIPLPDIDEQRRVAARLDHVSTAATDVARKAEHAAKFATAVTVASAIRLDLDDAAKARAGWRRIPLDDVLTLNNTEVDVQPGLTFSVAGIYSFGRGMFPRGEIDSSQTSYKTLTRVNSGQIVMSRLKAWEGAIALAPDSLDGWFVSPEFPTFVIDTEQAQPRFLEAVLTSEQFWSQLKRTSQGIGARRERVGAQRLLEQRIDLPPLDQQQVTCAAIGNLRTTTLLLERRTQRTAALVPAALNEAFAGLT